MTTTTTAPKFRKTKTGTWVVYGPAAVVKPGPVTVRKADGSTKVVTIASVGKTFTADGQTMVYGYEAERSERPTRRSTYGGYSRRSYEPRCKSGTDECLSFGVLDCPSCG